MAEDLTPTYRHLEILQHMRQGQRLAEGKASKTYAVAELDEGEEVELRRVEEMEEAGWIYVIAQHKKRRTWALTQKGIEVLDEHAPGA